MTTMAAIQFPERLFPCGLDKFGCGKEEMSGSVAQARPRKFLIVLICFSSGQRRTALDTALSAHGQTRPGLEGPYVVWSAFLKRAISRP